MNKKGLHVLSIIPSAVLLLFLTGCVGVRTPFQSISNRAQALNSKLEMRNQITQENSRLRQAEFDANQAEQLAQQQSAIRKIKQQRASTIPVVESRIGMNWQQGFAFSKPELDIEEIQERIDALEAGHDQRLADYRSALKQWHERRDKHYRDQMDFLKDATSNEKSCRQAPPTFPEFDEWPPEKPRVSMYMAEIPLKMSVQMISQFDDTFIEDVHTSRIPTNYKAPCEQDDDVPCDCTTTTFCGSNGSVTPPRPGPVPVPQVAPRPTPTVPSLPPRPTDDSTGMVPGTGEYYYPETPRYSSVYSDQDRLYVMGR
ncbi:MAG: hypothetical protein ACKVH8_03435 [Pirellulales bacterium]